ncbi:MAG: hypothetical protein WCK89_09975 [bacterium]
MRFSQIPERHFETAGVCIGVVGPVLITVQLHAEWVSKTPSSLSPGYLVGFLLIYFFWFLYGLRFRRIAVWLWNLVGVFLQALLLCVTLLK